jgi:hypothetical protein
VIAYRAILDMPRALAQDLARLLQAERRARGTRRRSRVLTCFRQAVFGLRWFRENRDVTTLARDHGISRATDYRYLAEVIDVLAGQAPELHDTLRQAKADGAPHLVLDGKLFATDRLDEKTTSVKGERIDGWYSGKNRTTGGNVQALSVPDGFPLWVSDVEPGSVHPHRSPRARAGRPVLGRLPTRSADLGRGGYDGAGVGVFTPIKQTTDGHALDTDNRTYNALLRGQSSPRRAGAPRWPGRRAPRRRRCP